MRSAGTAVIVFVLIAGCTGILDLSPLRYEASDAGTPGDAGSEPSDSAPADAADAGNPIIHVAAAYEHACVVRRSGDVHCWGANGGNFIAPTSLSCYVGQPCQPTPTRIDGIDRATQVAVGRNYACALRDDGVVLCWGSNVRGTLGTEMPAFRGTPAAVPGLGPALEITAGSGCVCARVREGAEGSAVDCWGVSDYGLLGTVDAFAPVFPPTRIASLDGAKTVRVAQSMACAILADSRVACWGLNLAGSLGHPVGSAGDESCAGGGGLMCNRTPTPVGELTAKTVAVGSAFACAIATNDSVVCWGQNGLGTLGNGVSDGDAHPTPAEVPGIAGATTLAAGLGHVCATGSSGLRCWGSNQHGEIGNGRQGSTCSGGICALLPAAPQGAALAQQLAAGDSFTVAVAASDGFAFGINGHGQLGHAPGTNEDLAACDSDKRWCNPFPRRIEWP